MRRAVLVAGMLTAAGCSGSDEQAANSPKVPFVEPYAGDPENYTSGGFQRHVYPVADCGTEIPLAPPFQVGDNRGGFDVGSIQAPLALLDHSNIRTYAPEGFSTQQRLSFSYPSFDRGIGMAESVEQGRKAGTRRPFPITTIARTLEDLGETPAHPAFTGTFNGRQVSAECFTGDVPNPYCISEIHIGSGGRRYRVVFPTHAAKKLDRIIQVGDKLFKAAEDACQSRQSK